MPSIHTGTPSDYILSDQNDGFRLFPTPSASGGDSVGSTIGIIRTSDDTDDSFSATTGIIRDSSDDTDLFPSTTGIIRDVETQDNTIEVWAKITPAELDDDSDSPDIPDFFHLGIVFGATERVLRIESEAKNEVLADFYGLMANDYEQFTARLVGRREPARTVIKGEFRQKPRARRGPRWPFNYEIPQP